MALIHLATTQEIKAWFETTEKRFDEITSLIQEQRNPERLVGKSEMADLLDCAESTIDGMRRKGIIKAYYVGIGETGHPKFRPSEVFAALKERSK